MTVTLIRSSFSLFSLILPPLAAYNLSICRHLHQVPHASHATLDERDATVMYLNPPCASSRPPLRRFSHFFPRKFVFAASASVSASASRPWHLPLAGHESDYFSAKRIAFIPSLLNPPLNNSILRIRANAAAVAAPVVMPSFVRSQERTYSWPPSLHHFSVDAEDSDEPVTDKSLSDIDDDPFSHFISPVIEEDDPYGEASWTAGIIDHDDPSHSSKTAKFYESIARKWSQYVMQHHDDEKYMLYGEESDSEDLSLATTTLEHEVSDTAEVERGDYDDYFSSRNLLHDNRLQIPSYEEVSRRSSSKGSRLTNHRRHSWREPSHDLFTVPEENENEASLGSLDERFACLKVADSRFESSLNP